MKKTLTIIFTLLASLTAWAQTDSLRGKSSNEMQTLVKKGGGFGAFLAMELKPSVLNDQPALYTGGKVAIVAGGALNIGVAGYGLTSNVYSNNRDANGNKLYYESGYGGLLIEPVIANRKLVHLTFPILLGAGGITEYKERFWQDGTFDSPERTWDMFFVAEPSINVELNITRMVRFSMGAGYRFVTDTELYNNTVSNLSGFTSNFTLKFGWFGK